MVKTLKSRTFKRMGKRRNIKRYKQSSTQKVHRKIEFDLLLYNVFGQASFNNASSVLSAPIYQQLNNHTEFTRLAKLYQFYRINGVKINYQRSGVGVGVPVYCDVDFTSPFNFTIDSSTAVRSDTRMTLSSVTTNNECTKYWPCEKDIFVVDSGQAQGFPVGVYGGKVWTEFNQTQNNNSSGSIIIGQQIATTNDAAFGTLSVTVYISMCKPTHYVA